jgi:hypothetical protein
MEIKLTKEWVQTSPNFCNTQWGEIWLECERDRGGRWKSSVSLGSFITGISLFNTTKFSCETIESAQQIAEQLAIKLLFDLRSWTNELMKQYGMEIR